MDRRQLESAGPSYPYLNLHGLYGVPFGLIWFLITLSNLDDPPVAQGVLAVGLVLCLAATGVVSQYYQRRFGQVTPTRSRRRRYYLAAAGGLLVFVLADQLARTALGRPPEVGVSSIAASWALGMLVFYALTVGLRAHHVVIWGGLLIAGAAPIWGVGVDRDALAFVPIGVATIASGILDHRLLVRTFRSYQEPDLADSNV